VDDGGIVRKFLSRNKWQCRILGKGGEGAVNAMSGIPVAGSCLPARIARFRANPHNQCCAR
jgi:hypothetical protein